MKSLVDHLNFPEGPAFAPDGSLWCVELRGGNLIQMTPGQAKRFPTGGTPNGLAFDHLGRAWVCDAGQNAIRRFTPPTGVWETVVDQIRATPLNKPNDLAFDARGNLVFTCPGNSSREPTGYVCCLTPDGTLTQIAEGLYFPNGLAFMDDGLTLVIAETFRQRLWTGEWDAQRCLWLNPQPWADVGGSVGPDGMALGADGRMYVAVYGSGQVKAVNASGRIVQTYDMPGQNPTNVAFDPSGDLGLVVTESEKGLLLSLPDLGPGAPLFIDRP